MKKVLVTGANGQLGRCIQGLSAKFSEFQFIYAGQQELDIADWDAVSTLFKKNHFDFCINCAAYTAVDKAESDAEKAFLVNVKGVENIAKACREDNTTLLHVSTDFVFDGFAVEQYSEKDKPNPLSVYGRTKLDGEEKIQQILEKHFIVRTSWLYSEYQQNFLKTMLRLSETRSELSVVSDQFGSPTYASDLAYMLLVILKSNSENYGIYHYSNTGQTSWYGFAKAIFEIAGVQINLSSIKTEDYPTAAIRPKYSVLCTAKTSREFDLEIPNWRDSLTRAIQNLKKD